jgi:predicted small secreted protein
MRKAATPPLAVPAMLAALSLLVTACGGTTPSGVASIGSTTTTLSRASAGSSSSGQSGPTEAQLLKCAECMRTHAYPTMPDPVPAQGGGYAFKGAGTPGGIDLNSPQYQSAAKACQNDIRPASRT